MFYQKKEPLQRQTSKNKIAIRASDIILGMVQTIALKER